MEHKKESKILNEWNALAACEYPGRFIFIGQEKESGIGLVAYGITGRSPSSQARKMELDKDTIWVRPTDRRVLQKGNIDLLIYPSVFCLSCGIAVSNGKQTVDVMACLSQGDNAAEILAFALKNWDYEPDEPAYTPRISGCLLPNKSAALSLIKRAPDGSSLRNIFEFRTVPGKGKLIMTYRGENMKPLPSFSGEPPDLDITGASPQEVIESLYQAMAPKPGEEDFRVAVACVFGIDMASGKFQTHIINRVERK